MLKLILSFSCLGGLLLVAALAFGNSLGYLSGYLFVASFVLILCLTVFTVKKMGFSLSKNVTTTLLTLAGMTLLYVLFVVIKSNT